LYGITCEQQNAGRRDPHADILDQSLFEAELQADKLFRRGKLMRGAMHFYVLVNKFIS
jgi:hypothetical protein